MLPRFPKQTKNVFPTFRHRTKHFRNIARRINTIFRRASFINFQIIDGFAAYFLLNYLGAKSSIAWLDSLCRSQSRPASFGFNTSDTTTSFAFNPSQHFLSISTLFKNSKTNCKHGQIIYSLFFDDCGNDSK